MFLFNSLEIVIESFFTSFLVYLPNLVGGILIFSIGVILSQIVKKLVVTLSNFFRIGTIIKNAKLGNDQDIKIWRGLVFGIIGWGEDLLVLYSLILHTILFVTE